MQVHNIQSNNNYNSPNFGTLNLTYDGRKMIKSWQGGEKILQKIDDVWKKELAETKYFDLKIDKLYKRLFIKIESKYSDLLHSCEAPLYVCDKPKGKKLWAHGTDLIDCGDWVSYPLKFASNEDAEAAFNTLRKYDFENLIISKIAASVDSVKILEKACENMYNKPAKASDSAKEKVEKLPFTQRLKNAWLALKG